MREEVNEEERVWGVKQRVNEGVMNGVMDRVKSGMEDDYGVR